MDGDFNVGDVVLSTAGRDSGRYFVVMSKDGVYVNICDGDLRKTDNQKKKKIKHLRPTGYNCTYVCNKLVAGEKATNAEIRRSIAEFIEENQL